MGRRILLIYTGGTIGMTKSAETGMLHPIDFAHLMAHVPELKELGYKIKSHQFDPPIDSSDMTPERWAQLVTIISERYEEFDGFVILHGTDTMAYTASALSFMLEGLSKPVILTGSQLPIGILRTDGKENLINAIELAAAYNADGTPKVPEVCVFFGQQLLRGNRSTKRSSEEFNAFASYNYPPLATTGINVNYRQDLIRKCEATTRLTPHTHLDNAVIAITLFPGILPQLIENVFEMENLRGIVLRTYGSGNAPQQPWLMDALHKATEKGKVIVNITQCDAGAVEMELYETGNQLLKAGVVSGGDMTVECAVAKLMFLFGLGLPSAQVREMMQKSLAGEITTQ